MNRYNNAGIRSRKESTVQWAMNSERTAVSVPTEGKALMAVGATLLILGGIVYLAEQID